MINSQIELLSFIGDQFLYISHKMSPFFNKKSSFPITFEYNGGTKIENITRIEVKTYGVSKSIT